MTEQLPLIIVNPAAGGGALRREWPAMAVRVRNYFGAFECQFTQAPGDGTRIAEHEAASGRRLIIACGGDGTISEIANGLARTHSDAELGILPHGSGGDFRKTLDLPWRLEEAARALAQGRPRKIDLIEISYQKTPKERESRYCINVSSFGMGGEVVKRANKSSKSLGGGISYALATLTTTLTYECPEIMLSIDESEARRWRISNVAVCNGRYFGAGMKVAPDAKLDDGLLDVIVIKGMSAARIIANARHLYAGTHINMPDVATTRATTVEASAVDERTPVRIEIDGEIVGQLPATFRVIPHALTVRSPK